MCMYILYIFTVYMQFELYNQTFNITGVVNQWFPTALSDELSKHHPPRTKRVNFDIHYILKISVKFGQVCIHTTTTS